MIFSVLLNLGGGYVFINLTPFSPRSIFDDVIKSEISNMERGESFREGAKPPLSLTPLSCQP
jgi:hypothetical protein